ncbi:unnamed protein product [Musa hybrid cultivar]
MVTEATPNDDTVSRQGCPRPKMTLQRGTILPRVPSLAMGVAVMLAATTRRTDGSATLLIADEGLCRRRARRRAAGFGERECVGLQAVVVVVARLQAVVAERFWRLLVSMRNPHY